MEGRGENARICPDLWRPLSTAQSIPPCHPVSPVCFPALRFPVHFVHAPSAGLPIRLALPAHTSEGRGGNARICPDLWRLNDAESCAGALPLEGRGGNARIYPDLWPRDAAGCCVGALPVEGRGENARNCPDLWRRDAAGSCAEEVPAEGRGGNARICPDLWRRADAESCAEEVLAEGRGGNARIYPNLWRPLSTATFIQPCHTASPVCFPALRFPVHFVHAPFASLPIHPPCSACPHIRR